VIRKVAECENTGFNNLPTWVKLEMQRCSRVYFFPGIGNCREREELDGEMNVSVGDQIKYRYEVKEKIGNGSFGQVVQVLDHKTNTLLALKVTKNKQRYAELVEKEIEILTSLKAFSSAHIVKLEDSFTFRGHKILAFELLGPNLYDFLQQNTFRGLSMNLLKSFAQSILQGLQDMHSCNIIHCDLKPENIVLDPVNKASVKLIDLGSACFRSAKLEGCYMQSRFYRGPEVVLGFPFEFSLDIWGFGCVLAELATGRPLFPAADEADLISRIVRIIGRPPNSFLAACQRFPTFFPENESVCQQISGCGLKTALKITDESFLQVIADCLQWEPEKRPSASGLLAYDWFTA
jgi:dual specificity tyrosine-phosphorylation-regulated kinase 2/3/4